MCTRDAFRNRGKVLAHTSININIHVCFCANVFIFVSLINKRFVQSCKRVVVFFYTIIKTLTLETRLLPQT